MNIYQQDVGKQLACVCVSHLGRRRLQEPTELRLGNKGTVAHKYCGVPLSLVVYYSTMWLYVGLGEFP